MTALLEIQRTKQFNFYAICSTILQKDIITTDGVFDAKHPCKYVSGRITLRTTKFTPLKLS